MKTDRPPAVIDQDSRYESTVPHEIGHTLGMDHVESGIMNPIRNDPKRSDKVDQVSINQMIESGRGIKEEEGTTLNLWKKLNRMFGF